MKASWMLAALAAMALAGPTSVAQDKPGGAKGHKPAGQTRAARRASQAVYACAKCKNYYPAAQAKQMGYKDAMGHRLARRANAPAGYKMGGATANKGEPGKAPGEQTGAKQASTMKCPVCKTMDMTAAETPSNTQAVKIKGQTWYCCAGCDMSGVADKD